MLRSAYEQGALEAFNKFSGLTDVQDKLVPSTAPYLETRSGTNPGREDLIMQAFRTNAALGNPSNVDAPAVNPVLSNTPGFSRAKSDTMGGVNALEDNV
jgi:hypothetical protein